MERVSLASTKTQTSNTLGFYEYVNTRILTTYDLCHQPFHTKIQRTDFFGIITYQKPEWAQHVNNNNELDFCTFDGWCGTEFYATTKPAKDGYVCYISRELYTEGYLRHLQDEQIYLVGGYRTHEERIAYRQWYEHRKDDDQNYGEV